MATITTMAMKMEDSQKNALNMAIHMSMTRAIIMERLTKA
jgi:hypothetical protein